MLSFPNLRVFGNHYVNSGESYDVEEGIDDSYADEYQSIHRVSLSVKSESSINAEE